MASTFSNCARLSSIVIPSSVTNIGNNVFYEDTYLTEVIVNATVPPTLGNNVFDYNAPGRLFKVPSGSVNTYKAATGWSNYADSIVSQ